jgi:hypothetical protein
MPEAMPEIPAGVYRERMHRLRQRSLPSDWDRLVVYTDREHSANLSHLNAPSEMPSDRATSTIGRPEERTSSTASPRNSGAYFDGRPIRASFL